MKCPSCGNKQTDSIECERCGIIFEKYRKRRERLAREKEASVTSNELKKKSSIPGLMVGLLVGGVFGGGAFYYFNGQIGENSAPVYEKVVSSENTQEHVEKTRKIPKHQKKSTVSSSRGSKKNALEGLALQLSQKYPVNNGIEAARNATVSIETSWGSGSGFFVSPNGLIITNRHVLKMKDEELNAMREHADKGAEALAREEKTLRYLKGKISQVRDKEMRQQVEEDIRRREKEYSKYKQVHNELLEKLSTIETASPSKGVKVVLIDGSEYAVDSVMMSDRFDLALLSVSAWAAPYLATSRLSRDQGQKVYAVGNPQGLKHSVTSGIVSGYREYDGKPLIQTDAPINPGNSGGPLIDKDGRVLGVNTMIIRDTEGIGFAIPMKSVVEEFGNYISIE